MSETKRPAHSIIVADRDVLIRGALADYLRHCGYRVIEAATCEEVVTVLEQDSASIQSVLADAELEGGQNAFELRLWVKQHHPHVTMMLAGNIDKAADAAGHLCDEGPHLKRPYDPQAVVEHIKRLIAAARSQQAGRREARSTIR